MEADFMTWVGVVFRFVHVVAGIMWIGNSLLFTWMELSLRKPRPGDDPDLLGTLDMLHGGGVFHLEKKVLHADRIPVPLHWFMWQSYTTWISGFILLLGLYHAGGGTFFLDGTKSPMAPWMAVLLSLGGVVGGWLAYDTIWRSRLKEHPLSTAVLCLGLLFTVAALYNTVFNGRALYLQIGVMMGTMMSANVFFHIIRNQKKFMATLQSGQPHDPALGKAAKFRSLHNHYMTFPVIFLMLSAHFPQLTGAAWNVPILAVIVVMLMLVKHLMNTRHQTREWLPLLGGTVVVGFSTVYLLLVMPGILAPVRADAAVAAGARTFAGQGCTACHIAGSSDLAPMLQGLYGSKVVLVDGSEVVADEAYLRESITNPAAKVVKGYSPVMPAYGPVLSEQQVSDLVAYIRSLSK